MLEEQQSPLAITVKRVSKTIHESQTVLMYHSDQMMIDPAGIEDAREATIAAGGQRTGGESNHTQVLSCAYVSIRSIEDPSR